MVRNYYFKFFIMNVMVLYLCTCMLSGWSDLLVALVVLCYLLPDSRSKADHSKVLYFNQVHSINHLPITFKHNIILSIVSTLAYLNMSKIIIRWSTLDIASFGKGMRHDKIYTNTLLTAATFGL